jgi:glycosyltransferase involved in cell wall biosynthesis
VRLVVQVPCLNEEETLPAVLSTIPKEIPGIDEILVLIIDDGSTDRTIEVARSTASSTSCGTRATAARPLLPRRRAAGARARRRHRREHRRRQPVPAGAHRRPVQPILEGRADIVIADRQVHLVEHFSGPKVMLQKLGSRIVNKAAGTDLPDAGSGFRAYSRDSLMLLNTITQFSYCMETIIQAGNKRMKIESVPIRTNPKTRESRLFKSTWQHVLKSAGAIVKAYIMYKPYVIFSFFAVLLRRAGPHPVRPLRGPQGGRRRRQPPAVAAGRHDPARDELHERHRRDHRRPPAHQPRAHRGPARARQEDALRMLDPASPAPIEMAERVTVPARRTG